MNADLVVIKSQEEMDFIYSLFVKPLQSGSAWIGLNFKGGSFLWIDGTKVAYRNWNIGEPNNIKGVEHCGRLWYTAASGTISPALLRDRMYAKEVNKSLITAPIGRHEFLLQLNIKNSDEICKKKQQKTSDWLYVLLKGKKPLT